MLVWRHRPELVTVARSAIANGLRAKLDPEDMVQETFLLAHQQFHQFHGVTPSELSAWLRRILASQLSRMVRRYYGSRSRDIRLVRPAGGGQNLAGADAWELPGSGTTPSRGAIRRELAERVESALRQLPEDYRRVIVWRERQGLTFAEIARLLDRSENAVRKLWPRALLALQHLLALGHDAHSLTD